MSVLLAQIIEMNIYSAFSVKKDIIRKINIAIVVLKHLMLVKWSKTMKYVKQLRLNKNIS
jgi:hypothetical protein